MTILHTGEEEVICTVSAMTIMLKSKESGLKLFSNCRAFPLLFVVFGSDKSSSGASALSS